MNEPEGWREERRGSWPIRSSLIQDDYSDAAAQQSSNRHGKTNFMSESAKTLGVQLGRTQAVVLRDVGEAAESSVG